MDPYHKIPTIFLRDPETNHKTLSWGQWATPELDYLHHLTWEFTEKIDGTNIRLTYFGNPDAGYRIRGRTDRADIPPKLEAGIRDQVDFSRMGNTFGDTTATLYGEGYGPTVQKGGGNYRDEPGFILFDVRIGGMWLKREDVYDVGAKLGLPVVPLVDYGTLWDAIELALSRPWSIEAVREHPMEGLICRPLVELTDRRGKRVIAKIKARDFVQSRS